MEQMIARVNSTVQKLPFWEHLSADERNYISESAVIKHYGEGSILNCNDSCIGIINVISGGIRVYMLSEEGREITLFRLKKDEICVLSASCVISQINFDTQMVAEYDCDVLTIGPQVFKRLVDNNIYVKCFMYELLTKRFSSVMWTMQQILFSKLDRRLATFLIAEYEKSGNPEIRMTHEQIAIQINSAREVVARMLKRFEADGLVGLKRGYILLKNPERLRNI